MKFLCVWECDPGDWDKILEKYAERMKSKGKSNFPQPISKWMIVGKFKAFEVWEAENIESLTEMYLTYTPEIKKWEINPVIETERFIELQNKTKN